MIIQIQSNNKNLLDLLYKNPNTDEGLYAKPLKNGVVIGNAVDANNYEIIFQDTKHSYLPQDSNAIDYQSYCSPLAILNIFTEFFGHALKSKLEFENAPITWLQTRQGAIDVEPCTITVSTFYINSGWYRDDKFLLEKYFAGVQLQRKVGKNFTLQITAATVFEAINLLSLVALFTHITNDYGMDLFIDDHFATKYSRILTNIQNVPYFVFYLYIKRAVKNDKQFAIVKPEFEKYLLQQNLTVNLVYSGTHQDRVKFISNTLSLDYSILDIGCGEFIYYKRFMNLGFAKNYYAVDADANFEKLGEAIANRYDADNLKFYTSLSNVQTTEKVSIIITEVIEHNTVEAAKALLQEALQFNFSQIIITTPNVSFNKYYSESATSRHLDHQFEFTETEFKNFITDCVADLKNTETTYTFIGDTINGIQPTQIAIIKNIQ